MGFPFGETVIVHRLTGKTQDGDGNDVPTYASQQYEGVGIGPGTTVELGQGQTLVTDELHAYFKPAIPLTELDRIEVVTGLNTGTYDVQGRPKHYGSPLTGSSVTDAKLKKVTG